MPGTPSNQAWWRRKRKPTGTSTSAPHTAVRPPEADIGSLDPSSQANQKQELVELPASPYEALIPELDGAAVFELPTHRHTLNAEVLELEAPAPVPQTVVSELPATPRSAHGEDSAKDGRSRPASKSRKEWTAPVQGSLELPVRRHTVNRSPPEPSERRDTLMMLHGHASSRSGVSNLASSPAASSERLRASSTPTYEGLQVAGSSSSGSNDRESHASSRGFRSVLSLKSRSPSLRPASGVSAKPTYPPYFLDTACFSAAGNTLYLWKPRETKIAVFSVTSPEDAGRVTPSLRLCDKAYHVAGGTATYVVVSLPGAEEAEAKIYSNELEKQPALSRAIALQLQSSKNTFAVSRDDKSLAMASRGGVQVWDLQTGSVRRRISTPVRELNPNSQIPVTVDSQRTAFSADSESIAMATRFSNGHVFIHAWNVEAGERSIQSSSVNMPPGRLHDLGLSSVFCDADMETAIVTAMVNSADRIIYPFGAARHFSWPFVPLRQQRFSYKVTSAAQSPSGRTFALATSDNQVFTFSLDRLGVEVTRIEDFSKDLNDCVRLKDSVHLGCPDDDTVFAFCFNKDRLKMIFAIITKDGSTRYQIRERFS